MKEPVTYLIEYNFDWTTRKAGILIRPSRDLEKHEADWLLRELRIVLNKQ